ncbi:hypothetical protein VF12_39045 [Nostoc linckia z15]|nr:hypothetical protein VF12_39045 [Nostoc linckia z15]
MSYEISPKGITIAHNTAVTNLYYKNFKTADFATSADVTCIEEAIDVTIQQQNGNDYIIDHYIFRKDGEVYLLDRHYTITSGRNSYSISGAKSYRIPLSRFTTPTADNMLELYHIDGFQQNEEHEKIPYLTALKQAYNAKMWNIILLRTDMFMLEELDVFANYTAAEINDIAYYASRAHGTAQATYLLEKVIVMEPSRAVAFLNLADCYWDAGKQEKALVCYARYSELMLQNKKQYKVPVYVRKRLNEKI